MTREVFSRRTPSGYEATPEAIKASKSIDGELATDGNDASFGFFESVVSLYRRTSAHSGVSVVDGLLDVCLSLPTVNYAFSCSLVYGKAMPNLESAALRASAADTERTRRKQQLHDRFFYFRLHRVSWVVEHTSKLPWILPLPSLLVLCSCLRSMTLQRGQHSVVLPGQPVFLVLHLHRFSVMACIAAMVHGSGISATVVVSATDLVFCRNRCSCGRDRCSCGRDSC